MGTTLSVHVCLCVLFARIWIHCARCLYNPISWCQIYSNVCLLEYGCISCELIHSPYINITLSSLHKCCRFWFALNHRSLRLCGSFAPRNVAIEHCEVALFCMKAISFWSALRPMSCHECILLIFHLTKFRFLFYFTVRKKYTILFLQHIWNHFTNKFKFIFWQQNWNHCIRADSLHFSFYFQFPIPIFDHLFVLLN